MSRARDIEFSITTTPVLAALDRAGVPRRDDHGRPINPSVRIGVLAAERDELREEAEQLREALRTLANWRMDGGTITAALMLDYARRAIARISDHRAWPDDPEGV